MDVRQHGFFPFSKSSVSDSSAGANRTASGDILGIDLSGLNDDNLYY
jgi:hypothetical protein